MDLIGSTLGNYRLTSLLGQEGSVDTYLGEHIDLERKVVIKVAQTQLTQPDLTSFINEWRTIARLDHPSIIHFLDFGTDDSRNIAYLVTEYAPNGTLRQRHPYGSIIPLPTVLSYVKQVAAALQYIHDHNIIHRDIKPDNMLVGKHQEILLSDFGIAIVDSSSNIQGSSAMSGTVSYMAPEQILGQPTFASDQYALGIVVYEWLCGMRPFRGSTIEIMSQHLYNMPPPSLRAKVPSIPLDVEEVVMIALAKDPQERFKNIQAFATALELASGITDQQRQVAGSALPWASPPTSFAGLLAEPEDNLYDYAPGSAEDSLRLYASTRSLPPDSQTSSDTSYTQFTGAFLRPHSADSISLSPKPPFSSLLKEVGSKFTHLFSGRKRPHQTELALFVIARATLEADDRAFIDKVYTVEAGISQHATSDFYSEPFKVVTQNPLEPLLFSILFHPGEDIILLEKQFYHLTYDPSNAEPQFISCQFRVLKPGEHSIIINFYRQQQWLKTLNFTFSSVEQSLRSSLVL